MTPWPSLTPMMRSPQPKPPPEAPPPPPLPPLHLQPPLRAEDHGPQASVPRTDPGGSASRPHGSPHPESGRQWPEPLRRGPRHRHVQGTQTHEEDALIVTKTLTVTIIPPRAPPRGVVDTALDDLPPLRNPLHSDDDLPRVDLHAMASVDHDSGIPLEYFDELALDGIEPVLSVSTPWVARSMLSPRRCASMTKAPQPSVWDVLVEAV